MKRLYIAKLIGSIVLLAATVFLAVAIFKLVPMVPAVITFVLVAVCYGVLCAYVNKRQQEEED